MCLNNIRGVLFFIIFTILYLHSAARKHHRCSEDQWRCDSGQCVRLEDRCDGIPHCKDGSDETANHCIHYQCPKYAFRCSYGACIAGLHKCDGHRDCADNSDETEFLCKLEEDEVEKKLQGDCGSELYMECASGECIQAEYRCDGRPDCLDGSDETVEICSHLFCPAYAFRCGYGGCIRGNAKCDGHIDCLDGSDEAQELCGYENPISAEGNETESIPKPPKRGCKIPFYRQNLIAEINVSRQVEQLGNRVPPGTTINFRCFNNFQLRGAPSSTCKRNKKWSHPIPKCTKECAHYTVNNGISTIATCYYNKQQVSCTDVVRIGTEAHINCAPGYTAENRTSQIMTCDSDAEWDFPKRKCTAKCGQLNGEEYLGPRPWDVSIYKRNVTQSVYDYQCSGAILSHKVVITASNCFTNDNSVTSIYETADYDIVHGIHRNKYGIDADIVATIYKVNEITLYAETTEGDNSVGIALLVLTNHFQFGTNLNAICLKFQGHPAEIEYWQDTNLSLDTDMGTAISSSHSNDTRIFLTHIIVSKETNGRLKLLNVNSFRHQLKGQLQRFMHLL